MKYVQMNLKELRDRGLAGRQQFQQPNAQPMNPDETPRPPMHRPYQPPLPPYPTLPQRLSIDMIHETVRQVESCMNQDVRSTLARIRYKVEPPATQLDRLAQQFQQEARATWNSAGLSYHERQIEAADDQVAMALITEIRSVCDWCEQNRLLEAKRDTRPIELAVLTEDEKRLNMLYDWLCHKWKFGRGTERALGQIVKAPSPRAMEPRVGVNGLEKHAGIKRKREAQDSLGRAGAERLFKGEAGNPFEQQSQPLKFATIAPPRNTNTSTASPRALPTTNSSGYQRQAPAHAGPQVPHSTTRMPVVLDLCSSSDDEARLSARTPAAKSPLKLRTTEMTPDVSTKPATMTNTSPGGVRRRTSRFSHVDLTWALDRTRTGRRPKSDPGPIYPKKPKIISRKESTLANPKFRVLGRGPQAGIFTEPPSHPVYSAIHTANIQGKSHAAIQHLDEMARRMSEAAKAVSSSIPSYPVPVAQQYNPVAPAYANTPNFVFQHQPANGSSQYYQAPDGRIFFADPSMQQYPHPQNIPQPPPPTTYPQMASKIPYRMTAPVPPHALHQSHTYHVSPPQAPAPRITSRPIPLNAKKDPIKPPSATKAAPKPKSSAIPSRSKSTSTLASDVLRAIGKHPTLPSLNAPLDDLLNKKAFTKYNPSLKSRLVDGRARQEGEISMAKAQSRTVQEAKDWWERKLGLVGWSCWAVSRK